MDEDGCMVTEKSFELIECGEPESVAKGNKTATKQRDENESSHEKKKIASDITATKPNKTNQTRLYFGLFFLKMTLPPLSTLQRISEISGRSCFIHCNMAELQENEIARMIFFGSFCLGMLSGFIDESLSKYPEKFYCLSEFQAYFVRG